MNRMTLIGRITKDLELKETTETKRKYTKFDVAINNGKDKNGNERAATFRAKSSLILHQSITSMTSRQHDKIFSETFLSQPP